MTDVFKLNVGEDCVVYMSNWYDSYTLAEVLNDALQIVRHYTSDLFYDMYKMTDIKRDVNDMSYGEYPRYVWALRSTGTDLVTLATWEHFESYSERAERAFVLTFGEYGINFQRIK